VPVNKVKEFEEEYLTQLEASHNDTLDAIRNGAIDNNITAVLEKVAKDLMVRY
jgi:F-type H+-transporting ATPase subunit alpha